jgi:predicted lysophospholipase L1 biosynthesis ABC-type transport system permease subunit
VVKDSITGSAFDPPDELFFYFPTNASAAYNDSVLVRLSGDPASARRRLNAALDQVAPSASDLVIPMDEMAAAQVYPFRVTWWVAGFLGGVALLMTLSGIYGVMSYAVSQRTREIGIRVALGAAATDVLRMVLRQSAALAATGAAVGAALALAVAPLFAHIVDVLNPYDWAAYLGTIAVVFTAAVAASYPPARRAAGIDPAVTLRGE